ncbi:MAG: hypothetical protein JNK12_05315 [Acidimicrobiales bacterium]|nr:hypothetical protein [Acidimicrobiales bacterium]
MVTEERRTDRRRLYEQLLDAAHSPDDLQQLWFRFGPALFEADTPYVLTALRHRAIDRYRSEDRRRQREEAYARDATWALDAIDPAERVVQKLKLAGVLDALSQLDPRDSWPLWWHVQGLTDPEIAERWDDAGFDPSHPTSSFLRKHRQRVRERLRDSIDQRHS